MDLYLAKKVFIITGGGSGIGAAISIALANEGAIPVIFDRSDLSEELKSSLGADYFYHKLDLGDANACAMSVRLVLERYGRLDGLVNNAGNNDSVGIEAGLEKFFESLKSNLGHVYTMMHCCLPYLRATKGAVVNIASKVALTGQGHTSGYAASKGGVLALTREWAAELASEGIRINAILPAEVLTPLYTRWLRSFANPEEKRKQITSRIPLENRMTKPEEIADIAVFLLSSRSAHTTGQWVSIDGGYVHLDRALKEPSVNEIF